MESLDDDESYSSLTVVDRVAEPPQYSVENHQLQSQLPPPFLSSSEEARSFVLRVLEEDCSQTCNQLGAQQRPPDTIFGDWCYDGTVRYENGEWWQSDECTNCTCEVWDEILW